MMFCRHSKQMLWRIERNMCGTYKNFLRVAGLDCLLQPFNLHSHHAATLSTAGILHAAQQ